MAAHSRRPAWEIPPAGEPGGLHAVHGVAVSQARRHTSLTWLTESSRKYFPPPDVGFPAGSDSKVSACSEGDLGSIPGLGRPPEKGMATHSSILAWRIPWTEEPGGLQSLGSQRVDVTERLHFHFFSS